MANSTCHPDYTGALPWWTCLSFPRKPKMAMRPRSTRPRTQKPSTLALPRRCPGSLCHCRVQLDPSTNCRRTLSENQNLPRSLQRLAQSSTNYSDDDDSSQLPNDRSQRYSVFLSADFCPDRHSDRYDPTLAGCQCNHSFSRDCSLHRNHRQCRTKATRNLRRYYYERHLYR